MFYAEPAHRNRAESLRETSISWPLPNSKFLHQHQTFVGNARFIARLYEMEQAPFISKVIEMAGIQDIADERVSYCPRKAVSSFAFALGACLPFRHLFVHQHEHWRAGR